MLYDAVSGDFILERGDLKPADIELQVFKAKQDERQKNLPKDSEGIF